MDNHKVTGNGLFEFNIGWNLTYENVSKSEVVYSFILILNHPCIFNPKLATNTENFLLSESVL